VVARYFAYGSNMNPDRVRERGIRFEHAAGARLEDFALVFDKTSRQHAGLGHANVRRAPGQLVEGVLYWLETAEEIGKMDRFESTPVNYSREVIHVRVRHEHLPMGPGVAPVSAPGHEVLITTWTYFANPAVRQPGLLPPRSYLEHLLAGRPYLSSHYYQMLQNQPCEEDR
jgi:hypothetical protein